jgi:predicted nucleotidyltransferase
MTLPEDLRQLLLALNAQGVEYLVVGGWAVGFYAEPRSTKDIDLFIRSSVKNSEAVFRALAKFGAPLAGVTPADFRDSPTSVIQVGYSPARADFLQAIDGVEFDEAWEQRLEFKLEGVSVYLISAEHLVRNKERSGRLSDLADVEAIREADRASGAESKRGPKSQG